MGPGDGLNEELMRRIGTRLGTQEVIARVDKFPLAKPDRIVATFRAHLYPEPITAARLELRLRLNDDVNIIYVEEWPGDRWACRWDRHENDHNAREHFHPPPVATTRNALDIDLPADPNRAVQLALQFVDDRINDVWQADEPTYPDEYEFDHEYGPDIRV